MGEKKTCINKYFHIHHVADTLFMKNQYALQNDYLGCINLPNSEPKKKSGICLLRLSSN